MNANYGTSYDRGYNYNPIMVLLMINSYWSSTQFPKVQQLILNFAFNFIDA